MLQQDRPEDFVISTGVTTTVRDFVVLAFQEAGISLEFKGEGVNEVGYCKATQKALIHVDPRYFRPTEVELLIGDCTKAKTQLKWSPKYDLKLLAKEMVASDLKNLNLK